MGNNNSALANDPILLELLMLMRQQAQPQNISTAQRELRRFGYLIWSSTNTGEAKINPGTRKQLSLCLLVGLPIFCWLN